MKIIAALLAGSMLGACLAGPAMAQSAPQTPSQTPILAQGFSGAFEDAKRQCHDLVRPYKGGMLEGRIPVDDGEITAAMMANESYPSAQEAVALRGFIAAFEKCEAIQLAFIKQYAAWDLPNVQYLLDVQRPAYLALMARQITYGMANRNINHAGEEVAARRNAMAPKEMLDRKALDAEFRGALTAVVGKCGTLYAPLKDGVLKGRIAFDRDEKSTPQMQADKSLPTDGETVELRKLVTATRQCQDVYKEFIRTYAPQYVPVVEREEALRMAVYLALAGQRISYGEANRRLEDSKVEVAALQKAASDAYRKRRDAEKAADAAKTAAASPQAAPNAPAQTVSQGQQSAAKVPTAMEAAYQDFSQKCDAAIAPFKNGILGGKIPMGRHESIATMQDNRALPTDAEAAAARGYLNAQQLCSAYATRYLMTYRPWLKSVAENQIDRETVVLTALAEKRMTFGEAARKLNEIELQSDAEVDAAILALKKNGATAQSVLQGDGPLQGAFNALQPDAGR